MCGPYWGENFTPWRVAFPGGLRTMKERGRTAASARQPGQALRPCEDTVMFTRQPRPRVVSDSGAAGGSVLVGAGPSNQGLRLRALQGQERGHGGGIKGGFVILDVGDNRHA